MRPDRPGFRQRWAQERSGRPPGTAGTLWARRLFLLLQRWLSLAEIGWLIAALLPVGWADRLSHGVDPAADRHAWTWAGLASWPKGFLG